LGTLLKTQGIKPPEEIIPDTIATPLLRFNVNQLTHFISTTPLLRGATRDLSTFENL
ncbi:Hypothetical predicted protein, partial [Pelobates cultripes]